MTYVYKYVSHCIDLRFISYLANVLLMLIQFYRRIDSIREIYLREELFYRIVHE